MCSKRFARGRPVKVKKSRVSGDRKSTRLNSSHVSKSYAVFCLKKKKTKRIKMKKKKNLNLQLVYSASELLHNLTLLSRTPLPQQYTLFPYTTLFRSIVSIVHLDQR